MFRWVKTFIFHENRKDFQYLYKNCGIADEKKNSLQPQVRNLNCQNPQVRMSATFLVNQQLRICGLTCGLAQLFLI